MCPYYTGNYNNHIAPHYTTDNIKSVD